MEKLVWRMAALQLKVVWRFAMLESGGRCVIVAGTIRMLLLFVYNWDSKEQVHYALPGVI